MNRKNCPQPQASHVCNFKELSIREHPEDILWTNIIIPFANLLKVLAVLKVLKVLKVFTIAEKSRTSASFLKVNPRDGGKIEDF